MRATRFEFEQRFFIIGAIFAVGFSFYNFDPVSVFVALQRWLAPRLSDGAAVDFQRTLIVVGAVLVFAAAMLRTWSTAYLRTEVVHDTGQHSEALVADGPFRHVRNPLYLASLPMAAGIGVLASRTGWLFLVAANWFFLYRLILREEEALRQSQGAPYRAYCRAVPRFWPSLAPRVPASGRRPRWGQAFAGESFIWIFGLAVLCLAVTLNVRMMSALFVLGFLAHFVVIPLVRKYSPPG